MTATTRQWLKSCARVLARRPASPLAAPRAARRLAVEQLEDRVNPVSLAPGNYSGTIAVDSEMDQPGTYTITGNLTVNPGVTLKVAVDAAGVNKSGVNVVIKPGVTVTVSGQNSKLVVNNPALFAAEDPFFSGTNGIQVTGKGMLAVTNAVFSRLGGTNGGHLSRVQVEQDSTFTAVDSTFAWDRVSLANSSTVGPVTNSAFDTVLAVQDKAVAVLAAGSNKRFQDIEINPGATNFNNPPVTLAPIGADKTFQQYVFPGNFTVSANTTLTVAADSKVVIRANATVEVAGTLGVTSPALFAAEDPFFSGTNGILVTAGGVLSATNAVFSRLGGANGGHLSRIQVENNGTFTAADSTFAWDRVNLVNDSIVGPVTNSAFDGVLAVQDRVVAVLAAGNNKRFQDIEINPGTTTVASVTLAPIGAVTTNQQYVFPASTDTSKSAFTVAAGTTLTVAANSKVVIRANATVEVAGTLGVTSPALFAAEDPFFSGTSGILVTAGGGLSVTNAAFSRLNGANGGHDSRIEVQKNGAFTVADSTFGWDRVSLLDDSIVGPVTNSAFDGVLTIQAKAVPVLVAGMNARFQDVQFNPGGKTTAPSLTLAPLGADTTNQQYVFPGNFTVAADTALNIAANSKVVIRANATVSVSGQNSKLVIDRPALFAAEDPFFSGTNGILVTAGGGLSVTNAVFSRLNGANGGHDSRVQVDNGGQLIARGASFGWDRVTLNTGSRADAQYNYFDSSFQIHSGADLSGNAVRNNQFSNSASPVAVVAFGTAGASIDLRNNYWGTTVTSVIESRIQDQLDDAGRPRVTHTPFLAGRPVQPLGSPTPPIAYSGLAVQNVPLSATLRSPSGSGLANVNEGTVTFRLLNSSGVVVGTPPAAVNVSAGAANVSYPVPAGTPGGAYTIEVTYNGTANFVGGVDASQSLVINPAATTGGAANAPATYRVLGQSVPLSATVTSTAGEVNGGTVTFTVLNGATQVGNPVTRTVTAGTATGSYTLPAGTGAGTYTIQAAFSGTPSFAAVTLGGGTLTVDPATAAIAAENATASFNASAQSVPLMAMVTSPAGQLNEGTVTFTVLNGATQVGNPVTRNVTAGTANGSYTLPAGTAPGTYTIRAEYSGTGNLAAATDTSRTLTVSPAGTTTGAANAAATFNSADQSVPLSATVTSAGGEVNGGTVTFTVLDGATPIGTAAGTVAAGAATASYTLPAGTGAGTYTIRAEYGGVTNFAASTDSSRALVVGPAATTTTAAAATATFGTSDQSLNLSATVTSTAGPVNAGTVTFTIRDGGGMTVGSPVPANVTAGAATGSYTLPAGTGAGTYTIRAVYNGVTNFAASTDASQTLVVSPAATTTTAAAATATFNTAAQSIGLSATVTSPAGPVNGGTVTFTVLDGATPIGTAAGTVAAGAATASYTLPAGTAAGTYTIRAEYSGTNFAASADASRTLTVGPAATTTGAVSTSVAVSAGSQQVPLSATVTSPGGTVGGGTVTFTVFNGASPVGNPVTGTVSAGVATASYTLPAGTGLGVYTIRAEYGGGTNFAASMDATRTLTVAAVATVAASSSSATFSSAGQSVSLTAMVMSPGVVVNEGTVTFTVLSGATPVGNPITVGVAAGAAAGSYTLPAGTGAGMYTIRAAYSGTANFVPATDTSHALVVNPAATTTVAAGASATSSPAGQVVNLAAAVTSPAGVVNTGTVTFTVLSGGNPVGNPVTANVTGGAAAAAYTLPGGTAAGTYTIRATFGGTANLATSSDATPALTVAPATSPAGLVGVPQFAVGADAGGGGDVTVYNRGGVAAYTVAAFPGSAAGARTIVADFNGDGVPDVAVGTGPGVVAEVKVFDGRTRAPLFATQPFATFTGGVFLAAGDMTGDGKAELVVTPDEGGGPRVTIFRGGDFTQLANFFGIDDSNFRGGARAALGDITGDGRADLVVSAGFGGGPRIGVYDGRALADGGQLARLTPDFFLFEPALRNGAYVAVGDIDGDGRADIVGGGGPGGGPRTLALSGRDLLAGGQTVLANFFAGDVSNRGGIRVGVKDLDGDRFADIVVGSGTGAGSRVSGYLGKDFGGAAAPADFAFDALPGFGGGVFVG